MIYRHTVLLLPIMAASAVCQPAAGGLSAEEMARLRAEYGKLNGQTFRLKGNLELGRTFVEDPERVPVVRKELLDLLRQAITRVLSSPRATEGQVQDAINEVQGDFMFGGWDGTNTPLAHFFSLNGDRCLAAAYAIEEGGEAIPDSQSFLDFYVKRNNEWTLQAVTGSEFRSSKFFVSSIPAGLAGESWFLVWGSRIGNSRGRLAIRLYAFDGDKVREVWKRDDLIGGEVEILGSSVTLRYLRESQFYDPVQEVLRVTPNGLQ